MDLMAPNETKLGDVARPHILDRTVKDEHPKVLYHMTDMGGFLGILEQRCLRASLATELNDASEVIHGMSILAEILWERLRKRYSEVEMEVHRRLGDAEDTTWNVAPYVVSACARCDRSGAWLNYGRAGRGVALGLKTSFAEGKSTLVQVDYDLDSQRERMRKYLDDVLQFVAKDDDIESAAEDVLHFLPALAVQMKNPGFADEEEWRRCVLFLSDRFTPPDGVRDINFRACGDRLIPYQELPIDPSTELIEIVLGHSAETSVKSVELLLRKYAIPAKVFRSTVSVR